ncbi:hypothetical protein ACA910_002254 [Epithemia clementina (nom. ined.)]
MDQKQLSYETIALVLDSWEELRRIPDYESVAGQILFQRLFQRCPQAKILFGFSMHLDHDSRELLDSKRFKMHAAYMIQMLDTAMNMLGPDCELLTEIMQDLGRKHIRYGVRAEYFPVMGEALVYTLKKVLGDQKFGEKEIRAVQETYNDLSGDMIKGGRRSQSQPF